MKKIVGLNMRAIKAHIKSKFENNYGFLISKNHADMQQKGFVIHLCYVFYSGTRTEVA